ncbi:MAG: protein-L-isoaspartate carboxylmethyltransferase, partial [Actinotalea sp.]|nr:protein-L-isoaspartate carboxylmethyltransferase [Actinotalea sp.]
MRVPRKADAVDRAMVACPRTGFLPEGQLSYAGQDRPLPLWHGQTSSQPSTVAAMLRLLDVPPGVRVLDVGAGSGWTTALLAHLVGEDGDVVGVELEPELATWGARNVAATAQPWARVVVAEPGVLGLPQEAPFDRILVSAEAPTLPRAFVDQLAEGGRLVLPVAGEMLLVVPAGPG